MELRLLENHERDWGLLKRPWVEFFRNEPITSAIPQLHDTKCDESLHDVLYHCVTYTADSPIVYAWDSEKQQTAGFVITMPVFKNLPEELKDKNPMLWREELWDTEFLRRMNGLEGYLDALKDKADVFTRYSVDKALLIHITSVCPEYTRRGLANKMTDRVLNEAKDAGYEIVMSTSTSAYTQRSKIKHFGFEVALELDFENNYPFYEDMTEEKKASHPKGCCLVKRL